MSTGGFSPIRVLVIDDSPDGLWRRDKATRDLPNHPGLIADPRSDLALHELFDVRWIATPEEAREFRDLSRFVSEHDLATYVEVGWLPEVVVADYMLKENAVRVEEQFGENPYVDRVSPLPKLRRHAKQHLEWSGVATGASFTRLPDSEADYGCFAAGMILSQFADHPCVPVTITANNQAAIRGRMTEYFEWLLSTDTGGALRAAGLTEVAWRPILQKAAQHLRTRIEQLAKTRTIAVSLADILRLQAGDPVESILIESRYGIRSFPVHGLFCDYARTEIDAEAQKWSGRLLASVVSPAYFGEIRNGMKVADILWRAYDDETRVAERLELAGLVRILRRDRKLARPHGKRLQALWPKFSAEDLDLIRLKKDGKSRIVLGKGCVDLREELIPGCTDNARRWASLMIMARLVQRRHAAVASAGSKSRVGIRGTVELSMPLRLHDVFLALFPVAKDPLTLDEFPSSSGAKSLKAWKDPAFPRARKSKYGNIGLDISDVLDGVPWRDGEIPSFGIKKYENAIIAWYALSIGFGKTQWDQYAHRILDPKPTARRGAVKEAEADGEK